MDRHISVLLDAHCKRLPQKCKSASAAPRALGSLDGLWQLLG